MISIAKRLRIVRLEFSYTFEFGAISGSVEGEFLTRKPDIVYNLRNLKGRYISNNTHQILEFNQVYGQFNLDASGALFSGSSTRSMALFSLNDRGQEAIVFDGHTWIESSWDASQWHIHHIRPLSSTMTRRGTPRSVQEQSHSVMPMLTMQSA